MQCFVTSGWYVQGTKRYIENFRLKFGGFYQLPNLSQLKLMCDFWRAPEI